MIRRYLAWGFYWAGDVTSKVLAKVPDEDRWDALQDVLYTIYNRLMVLSIRLQGDGPGPWR